MNAALLLSFTKHDFIDRYSGSMLGLVWAFMHPLAMIFIFTVVFANVMGARLPGVSSTYSYGIYLVAGLVPWMAFSNTVARSSTVFVDKKNVLSKVRVSLPYLPLYIVLSETATFLITLGLFLAFLVITGSALHPVLVLLPLVYIAQQLFAYALGLLLGIVNVFFRDTKEFVGIVMQFWFWLTPIVYVADIIPESVRGLLYYNPAYLFVSAYQSMFVFGTAPDMSGMVSLFALGIVLLSLVHLLFRKVEGEIRDLL